MENSGHFKYCPRCGGGAEFLDSRKIVCAGCGLRLYLNTAAAVAGLIFDAEGRLLVIRRNHDPKRGFLDLPGGFVDFNENAEEALRREVYEELGIKVGQIEYFRSIPNVYEYAGVVYHTLDLFLKCRAESLASARLSDEITEILYMRPSDISEDDIAFDSIKNLIRLMNNRYLNN